MQYNIDSTDYAVELTAVNLDVAVTSGVPLDVTVGESARLDVGEAVNYIKSGQAEIAAEVENTLNVFNTNAAEKTSAFNVNAADKITEFNNNASAKTDDFNANAATKTVEFNSNADDKTTVFNTNVSNKTDEFNDNYADKLSAFDSNASDKTAAFDLNAGNKTTAFNDNATAKTTDFNDNYTAKVNAFNANASDKTTDFNTNASTKTTAFDSNYTAKKALIDAEVANAAASAAAADLSKNAAADSATAAGNSANVAKQWAIGDPSEPSGNSAKYWANEAATTYNNKANVDLSNLSASGEAKFDAKQDVISDLATIRSGAALGATAVQNVTTGSTNGTISVDGSDVAVHGLGSAAYTASTAYDVSGAASTAETNAKNYADGLASNYATAAQGALADTALQAGDNVSELTNNSGYITSSALAPYATTSYVDTELEAKQDVLTAGTDLEIVGYAPTTVSGNGSVSLNNAIANGLISVTLTGGCEQNGTPTPTNPVDIICNNGAIKYSKNIFDKTLNAAAGSASRYWEIQVPNGTYTCSTDMPHSGGSANVWFDIQPVFSSNVNPVFASQPRTITVTEGVLYVAVRNGGAYDSLMSGERWVQVEQGNTPTTYHPYGIYIDGNIETISDGNGNTAIAEYLLSVGDYKDTQELLSGEITRNVGIKVLDGTEPWYYSDSGGNSTFYSSSTISTNVFGVSPYSNRYRGIPSASGRTDGNIYILNINNNSRLDIVDNRFTNATDWKAYLSEQYYAGNPVIVVYAIGDSTSETAQAQTLTTQEGSNTISITQASINNLPVSVNYNMSGNAVINFTNETGYTSFSEIKDKLAYYGTCTTGASTQNKIVDCNGFELSEGVSIRIKFTNAQTYNGQPTLNVNNTGAIGVTLRADTDGIRYMWQAGDVIEFTYDGTNWIWERGGVATSTYYGVTKLTSSATSSSASLSLTASSLNAFSRDMVSGAQIYSSSTTYAVGDRVRYQYQTWECTSPTTGTWDENSWNALDPLQIQVDGKQDTLVSGTNIKTINNTSILGSGNIDIQGGSSYTAGTGIDITNDVISVTNAISTGAALGATAVQPSDLATVATSGSYSDLTNIPTNLLKNTATASSALTISGIATDKNGAINIGTSSQATGNYGVSLGAYSYANGSLALGLGYSARATANYAIQLGQGTNSTASTLYVGFHNSNYLLLDGTTGLIPDARLSSNILRSADLSGYATENWVNNQGYLTGITSSDVTTALGYTPYNATNPNGYITSSALSGYALDADVVHLTGTQSISGTKTFLAKTNMAPIELYPVSSGGSYIDFHYNNSTSDYTSRIIEQASGDLVVTTNDFTINANGYARASDTNGSIVTTVNKSKSANGYFKLGNGLIIQWGRASGTITSSNMTITFPIPFTSASSYSVSGNITYNRSTGNGWGHINSCTSTGFNAVVDNDEKPFNWIAIGY